MDTAKVIAKKMQWIVHVRLPVFFSTERSKLDAILPGRGGAVECAVQP